MKDWNELQAFVAVAKSGSFTRAGDLLAVPKSTVSRMVQRLEDRLGTQLLERSTRRVELTRAGELMLDHGLRFQAEADQAELAVKHLTSAPRGPLRVGAPVTFARSFLAPVLPGFLRKFPAVTLKIVLGSAISPALMDVDVLIRAGGRLEDASIVARKLREVPIHIYASPGYLSRMGMPEHPRDLVHHTCCGNSQAASGERWRFRKEGRTDEGRTEEVRIQARVSVGDPVIHHELARSGMVIGQFPEWLARSDERAGRLVRLLPGWRLDPVLITALYPSRGGLLPNARAFLDYLAEKLPSEPES
ncbi:MAG: LysR family transcriptional regulator [Bryobacterales bacterium]|nr:LysR family transcriptional regulator [Bryobacterales bacterium]